MHIQRYDITIIGAGLIGSSLIIALNKLNVEFNLNLKIAIIDKKNRLDIAQQLNPELNNRGIVLSRSSIDFLQKIHVWDQMLENSYKIDSMHISAQNSFGGVYLESKNFNLDYFGYITPIASLINVLNLSSKCTTINQSVTSLSLKQDVTDINWQINLANDQQIISKLVIAADGENSLVRNYLNIPTKVIDYQQKSLVANLDCGHTKAFLRFTTHGTYALLPFGENKSKFILSSSNKAINYYMLPENNLALIAQINQVMGGRIPVVTAVTSKVSYSLKLSQALCVTQTRLILIGNAANTMHPVVAQGYNLGLRDVAGIVALFRAGLIKNNKSSNTFYDWIVNQYADLRAEDHRKTVGITHEINSIFTNNLNIIKVSRKIGLFGVGMSLSLKKQIVQFGIGI